MSIRILLLATALCLSAGAACPVAAADGTPTLQAVPSPDLSRLPAARASELRAQRASFENSKSVLIGDPLAETYALLGAAYARNGFPDAAAVALANAIALAPRNGRWLYMRGVLRSLNKQDAAARGDFEAALKLDPNYLPIRVAVANNRIQAGDLDGARKVLEPLAQGREAVPLALLGDIALRQRRAADAVELFKRALAIAPEATRLNAQLATAYTAAGDAGAAAQARAKAGDVLPTLYDPIAQQVLGDGAATGAAQAPALAPREQAIVKVLAQLKSRDYDAARRTLDEALRASPNDSMLLALYGHVEAASGHLPMAQTRLAMALRADPANGMAHVGEGLVKEMQGDDVAARAAYEKAIQVQPGLAAGHFALAAVHLRAKRYDAAADEYRAVVRNEPGNDEAWSRLVAAQAIAGRCADTLKALNDALRKTPNEGFLLQLFVRSASTCTAAGAQEKRMAFDYGVKLYRSTEMPVVAEAYALALAANGKWDDAVTTQQGAMFVVLRNEGQQALPPYKDFLEQFRAHKLPTLPWPAQSELFNPPRAQVDKVPAGAGQGAR